LDEQEIDVDNEPKQW